MKSEKAREECLRLVALASRNFFADILSPSTENTFEEIISDHVAIPGLRSLVDRQ